MINIKKPTPTQQSQANNHPDHDEQQNDYQMSHQPRQLQGFNQLPVQESEQSEEGDILNKIDSLLQQNGNNSSPEQQGASSRQTQKEMLLNFKINQMQKIIQNLNQANKKLNRKLQEQHSNKTQRNKNRNNQSNKNNEQSNMLNSSSQSNVPFNDQLTQMQGDFQEIQGLLKEYKDQLVNSENKWNAIREQKDEQIESLKNEIIVLSQSRQMLQSQLNQFSQENQLLKNKNQQLLIELQSLSQQLQHRSQYSQLQYPSSPVRYPNYYETPAKKFQALQDYRFNQKIQNYRFNQKIEKQMETMIKKLLKQLSFQRKINCKMNLQIKRLNNQLIELQKKIKLKNDTIYQLEMKIINIQKTFSTNLSNAAYNPNNNQNPSYNLSNYNANKRYTPINMNNKSNSLKNSLALNKGPHLTPTHGNKNQSIQYQSGYNSKPNLRHRHEPHDILMKQYEADYTQYSESHQGNIHDEYAELVSIKPNKSPIKSKSQNTVINNNGNIKNQMQIVNTNKLTQQGFIKAKKPILKQQSQKQQQQGTKTNNKSPLAQLQTQPKQFISFTLMQLHEGKFKITMKQKIIIISRLIDLYCKKIKNKNYYNLIAQQIQIYNFNEKHPNLIRIRIVDPNSNNSKADISSTLQQDTQESLMYNLAFIVENLIKEVQTIDQRDLEVDLNLNEIIQDILTKSQQDKIAYFHELSKSLENSVTTLQ